MKLGHSPGTRRNAGSKRASHSSHGNIMPYMVAVWWPWPRRQQRGRPRPCTRSRAPPRQPPSHCGPSHCLSQWAPLPPQGQVGAASLVSGGQPQAPRPTGWLGGSDAPTGWVPHGRGWGVGRHSRACGESPPIGGPSPPRTAVCFLPNVPASLSLSPYLLNGGSLSTLRMGRHEN